jgi:hypothetical protein
MFEMDCFDWPSVYIGLNIYFVIYIRMKRYSASLNQFKFFGEYHGKLLLCLSFALILLGGVVGYSSSFNNEIYAQSNTWYVGKGLQPDTYYTYKIQEHDTNQGRPFLMTIYFKEFDNEKNYWIAPFFVVDRGNVVNGTLHLSSLDLSALGTSEVPQEAAKYKSAYTSSLQWLSSFVPKPGQSLSAPYWGKIAAIGGSPIAPSGSAKITVPAGTFDTVAVSWHYGEDNHIWVSPNLPYPVKGETFAAVTTGNAPIQYAYELQSTGKGQPPIPKSAFEAPKPPLTVRTSTGDYYIRLLWDPPIAANSTEEFGLVFMNPSQSILPRVTYGFEVISANGTSVSELTNQRALDGTSTQEVSFPSSGLYTIEVNVESVAGKPLGIFIEKTRFTVQVE